MNNLDMREYIINLLEHGHRIDGRKLDELRKPIEIKVNVSKNAEGSSNVKIGSTEVMAGIKMTVGEPFADSPDQGVLMVGVELLPLSSPEFESGPPDEWATEMARVVDRGIRESKMIDMKKLCIREGELVWMIFLDLYTINDDGNLIDACALAAISALKTAVFPVLEKDKVKFGEFTKNKLPITKIPVTCTLSKIGPHFIVDATTKEEKVSDARISICLIENNNICAMQKGGGSGIEIDDLKKVFSIVKDKTKELRSLVTTAAK